ncbi:DUF3785 family protein [Clostridium weizhouense]|uniref:DUF3785 domain-containing protein n=1 Tax=Clostridium weizhouense TaxID=2859781 RepID=A0ABS7AS19_9CLOT|nr:DUF3785 family protein [Clostridium weizhouense]MBW6411472.1 DUF3785 domain-containing protein [Clostridium weizhouense]
MNYKFVYNDKEYILSEENCDGIFFETTEDDKEIDGISLDIILSALSQGENVEFTKEYYSGKCECNNQENLNKSYGYLEYHFYIYTKNLNYVINTLCEEYKNTSYNKLSREGKIDDSYIVSVIVCPCCSNYLIDIEQCTV